MKLLWLFLLTSMTALSAPSFEAGKGYPEHTQFLLYPYIDMAYRYIDEGRYELANEELNKALAVTPNNPYVVERLLFVAAQQQHWPQLSKLINQYQQVLMRQRKWREVLLHFQQLGLKHQAELFIVYTDQLLADERFSITQRTELAALSAQMISERARAQFIHRVITRYGLEEVRPAYCFALLNEKKYDAVASCINDITHPEQQTSVRKHLIQALLGAQHFKVASEQFSLYQQHVVLSEQERRQWLQATIYNKDWSLALTLNAALPRAISRLLQRADIAMQAQQPEVLSRTMAALREAELNIEQEQQLLVLMAYASTYSQQWRQRLYDYSLQHAENDEFWRSRAVQVAQAMEDHSQWLTIFEAQQSLSEAQQRQLAIGYEKVGNEDKAYQQWLLLARLYPQRLSYAKQASHMAIKRQQYELVTHILAPFWPFSQQQDQDAEMTYRYLQSLKKTQSDTLRDALVLAQSRQASPAQRQTLMSFASAIGECQLAAQWLVEPAKEQALQQLGYCFIERDKERAYALFQAALATNPSSTESRVQLAHLSEVLGLHVRAYEYWLELDSQLTEQPHFFNAIASALKVDEYTQAMTWLHRLVRLHEPKTISFYQLQLQLARYANDLHTQEKSLVWLLENHPDVSEQIALARLYWRQGKTQQTFTLLSDIERQPTETLALHTQAELAYLYIDVGRAAKAASLMRHYLANQPDLYPMHQQLAYSYVVTNELDNALHHATIAATNMDTMELAQEPKQQLKRLRRDLLAQSRWLLQAQFGEQLRPIDIGATSQSLRYGGFIELRYSKYLQHHWRAQDTHQWYARAFVQKDNQQHDSTLALGYSWQPLASLDLQFAIEPQWQLRNNDVDILLKAATDLFSLGGNTRDWQTDAQGWLQQSLYLEAAHWLKSGRDAQFAQYQGGYHFKLHTQNQQALTWQPYVNGQWTRSSERQDTRVGAGVGVHWWSGGDDITAYRRQASLKLLVQHVLNGEREGDNVASLDLEWSW
ncbi:NfrA family protein [Pseudoalteromonas ruthenica]|uniref:NfrA family protein n=1 Tax=Pseudoalteromonas ruthenica TaxID=151081 RepID=UPI0003464A8A|nr:hypothetical protein [Pseudoalteromonas ruthenica]